MSNVNIKFFRPHVIPGVTAVYGIDAIDPETIVSSGTSQVTTSGAPDHNVFCRVASSGGDVWISIGASPTAVSGEGTLILDGIPEIFKLESGDKIAVID